MEIKIAVCDDEHELAQYIKNLVGKWADDNSINAKIEIVRQRGKFQSCMERK